MEIHLHSHGRSDDYKLKLLHTEVSPIYPLFRQPFVVQHFFEHTDRLRLVSLWRLGGHIYKLTYIYTYVHTYRYMHMCTHIHIFVYICVYLHIHTQTYMYVGRWGWRVPESTSPSNTTHSSPTPLTELTLSVNLLQPSRNLSEKDLS